MLPVRPFRWAICALGLGTSPLAAQGGMRHGDSTTAAVMQVVHQLLVNHDKLRRTVVNLPNGVRTVTESDDPAMVAQIRQHVAMTGPFVASGRDPNLPMSTAALRGVPRNGTKVVRQVETTAKGVVVVETSDDPTTVALLQQHAAEITDQVKRGMTAVHGGSMPAPAPSVAPAPVTPTSKRPTRAGQEAFATIAEIVRLLDADSTTDWSKVDLEALR